jgi:DNA polymerase III delta subunit
MIISPDKIILNTDKNIYNKKVFLISGNEETYINKIEKIVSSKIYENENKEIIKISDKAIVNRKTAEPFLNSLFHQYRVLIFYNPKDIDMEFLKNTNASKLAVIICLGGQKNQNKIKKPFEKDKDLVVVSCYKLSKEIKKLYFESFLNKNNISIDRDGYWFFLENVSDYYQLFENEMEKLLSVNLEKFSINDVRMLITRNENHEIEKLFFLILRGPKEIMLETSRAINSDSDSYILLQRIKFFISLMTQFKTPDEAANNFPKYLFKEKPLFLLIFSKINSKKLTKVYLLIKKTEMALRKKAVFYSPICQRFMINLSKEIK